MMNISTSAILLYAIAGAAITIYLPFLVVAYGRAQVGNDLHAPRTLFDKLPPYAQRATWAHSNSFEAFMIFAAAALMAYVTGVDSVWATAAALIFVIVRILYSVFYILDIPVGRMLMFALSSLCSGTLFILSLMTANHF